MCCTQIAMAQVMQRMKLTWLGEHGDDDSTRNTFKVVVTIVVSYIIFINALEIYIESFLANNDGADLSQIVLLVHDFGSFIFMFWSVVALCQTRRSVRETYSIPGSNCEDCCVSTFCSCCAVAHIARHTGEFETYPVMCCSDTGLGPHAPMAV